MRAVGLFDGPHATKRGFNLAVLHPATGVVTHLGKFDVAANHKASVPVCRLTATLKPLTFPAPNTRWH